MKNSFKTLLVLLVLHNACIAFSQQSLPIKSDVTVRPLQQLTDSLLQSSIEEELRKNKIWKNLIKTQNMSIGIVDLHDLNDIKYAGINDTFMMYAASLPKIAILLAAMDAIENKELIETPEIKKDLKLMISKSNNAASTRMIDRLGYEKIEAVLRSPKHRFYDEKAGGGLWVGKRYAAGGRRYPEPLKGLSHAATTRQVCNFYYQLVLGNLISFERSKQMLGFLKDPALHHKFVNTLEKIAPKAKLFRKSGSWKSFHSDSILVWGPKRKYILVALIDNDFGEQIIRDVVIPIEKVLKTYKTP